MPPVQNTLEREEMIDNSVLGERFQNKLLLKRKKMMGGSFVATQEGQNKG